MGGRGLDGFGDSAVGHRGLSVFGISAKGYSVVFVLRIEQLCDYGCAKHLESRSKNVAIRVDTSRRFRDLRLFRFQHAGMDRESASKDAGSLPVIF